MDSKIVWQIKDRGKNLNVKLKGFETVNSHYEEERKKLLDNILDGTQGCVGSEFVEIEEEIAILYSEDMDNAFKLGFIDGIKLIANVMGGF